MAIDKKLKLASRDQRQSVIDVLNSHCLPKLVSSQYGECEGPMQLVVKKQLQDKEWYDELGAFCRPLILGEFDSAQILVERLIAENTTIHQLYKTYFPAAARLLGDMWLNDECSFAGVTIGLEVLHRLVSYNAAKLKHSYSERPEGGSILIAPLLRETHIFGAALMETVYNAAKWRVKTQYSTERSALVNAVMKNHYDVIAFSLNDYKRIDECKLILTYLRDESVNRRVKIAVGGHVFDENSDAARYVGADLQVTNIVESLDQTQAFLAIDAI